jgi:hypothetical protein
MESYGDWGDFSEWLERINESIARESDAADPLVTDLSKQDEVTKGNLLKAIRQWIKRIEQAPKTTWFQELDVRGFTPATKVSEKAIPDALFGLIEALASMRVFLVNTDHLDDWELYQMLVGNVIRQPVAHVPFDERTGIVIDIVACEVAEDPTDWLKYYANNRERMEWAKQNPGKPLPQQTQTPYKRDYRLPKP